MLITTTGYMALDYTLETHLFAAHLSAQCKTKTVVLLTLGRSLTDPNQVFLCLLHLPHLVLFYLCRTLEAASQPPH
jgi:hypothetical protein